MAPPPLISRGWKVAAGMASVTLVLLAVLGGRPDPGAVRSEPAGLMRAIAPAEARHVRVSWREQSSRFTRNGARWAAVSPAPATAGDPSAHVENGLRLLHGTAPQRVMTRDEYTGVAARDFGLAPPRYTVTVEADGGRSFTIHFGGANAQGAALYAQVVGRDELFLLPPFTAEPWEFLLAAP